MAAPSRDELKNLFAAPLRKPKRALAVYNNADGLNSVHQIDLLELPQDPDGSRYALVVVDLATRRVAARPLASKTAAATAISLRDIYEHDSKLRIPRRAECDAGGEFHGSTASYLRDGGAMIRYGEPGRHRQQGMVERVNGLIGRAIMIRQSGQELLSGEPSREWVDDLQAIVAGINKRLERKPPKLPRDIPPPANAVEREILLENTLVRRRNDRPTGVLGDHLGGAHRAGDPTYETRTRRIEAVLLRPGIAPRYILEGLPSVSYGRWEIQVVPADEHPPRAAEVSRPGVELLPARLLEHKKEGRSVSYFVESRGRPEGPHTWQTRAALMRTAAGSGLVRKWERAHAE